MFSEETTEVFPNLLHGINSSNSFFSAFVMSMENKRPRKSRFTENHLPRNFRNALTRHHYVSDPNSYNYILLVTMYSVINEKTLMPICTIQTNHRTNTKFYFLDLCIFEQRERRK